LALSILITLLQLILRRGPTGKHEDFLVFITISIHLSSVSQTDNSSSSAEAERAYNNDNNNNYYYYYHYNTAVTTTRGLD